MGRTVHAQANERVVNEQLQKSPEYAIVLTDCLAKMNDHFFGLEEVIVQKYRAYDIYDAAAFMQIHTALCFGAVLYAEVGLGAEPFPDKCRKENNEALSKLWYPFSAKFYGRYGDSDGYFQWEEPIGFGQILPNGKVVEEIIHPFRAPLEVGYTHASKSLQHLAMERCLARWPYNSKTIYLFFVVNENLWNASAAIEGISPWENWVPPIKDSVQLSLFC